MNRVLIGKDVPIDKNDFGITLQQAIDLIDKGGTIEIPYGFYQAYKPPFWDKNDVDLLGNKSTIYFHQAGPGILLLPRKPSGIALPADHRVDAFGQLDISAAPKAGVRWGYQTYSKTNKRWSWLGIHASPLSHGRYAQRQGMISGQVYNWNSDDLLIEIAFSAEQIPGRGWDNSYMLAGVVDRKDSSPWILGFRPALRNLFLAIKTQDGVSREFNYPINFQTNKVHREIVHFNAAKGIVRAWVDGQKVTIDLSKSGPNWAPGLKLGKNCCSGLEFMSSSYAWDARRANITYWGFRVSDTDRYTDDQQLTRKDGQPVNDYNLFFNPNDTNILGALLFNQPPSDNRLLTVGTPAGNVWATWNTVGYIFSEVPEGGAEPYVIGSVTWRDLKIVQNNGVDVYGAAVMTASLHDFTATNVEFNGSAYGWYTIDIGAPSYPMYFDKCRFNGADSGFLGKAAHAWFDKCWVSGGRFGYHFGGSAAFISKGFLSECNGEAIFRIHWGTQTNNIDIEKIEIDHEFGNSTPIVAPIWASTNPGGGEQRISINNVTMYHHPNWNCFALFDDPYGVDGLHYFSIYNCYSPGFNTITEECFVKVASAWTGDIIGRFRIDTNSPTVKYISPPGQTIKAKVKVTSYD